MQPKPASDNEKPKGKVNCKATTDTQMYPSPWGRAGRKDVLSDLHTKLKLGHLL